MPFAGIPNLPCPKRYISTPLYRSLYPPFLRPSISPSLLRPSQPPPPPPPFSFYIQFIKDYHLMLLVLVFVLVDTIILVVVMSLDNSRFRVTIIPNKQDTTPHIRVRFTLLPCSLLLSLTPPFSLIPPTHPLFFPSYLPLSLSFGPSLPSLPLLSPPLQEDGIKEISVVSRCLSTTEPYWISLLFGYKAIIQAIGLYLAFKIRNIKIRGLNDSREVSIILYITSVLMIVILVNNFVFGDYIDVDGAVYGIGLSSAVTVVLCLTFIPKVYMYVCIIP